MEFEGAIYHVTVRANGKSNLFADDRDRRYLLACMYSPCYFNCSKPIFKRHKQWGSWAHSCREPHVAGGAGFVQTTHGRGTGHVFERIHIAAFDHESDFDHGVNESVESGL